MIMNEGDSFLRGLGGSGMGRGDGGSGDSEMGLGGRPPYRDPIQGQSTKSIIALSNAFLQCFLTVKIDKRRAESFVYLKTV